MFYLLLNFFFLSKLKREFGEKTCFLYNIQKDAKLMPISSSNKGGFLQ